MNCDTSMQQDCSCKCHKTGVKLMHAINPPIPCCKCEALSYAAVPHKPDMKIVAERLEKLEKWMDDFNPTHERHAEIHDELEVRLSQRIEKLELLNTEHQIKRIATLESENVDIKLAINNLEKITNECIKANVELINERLDKLDEMILEKYAHPDVISRIEKLESRHDYNKSYGIDLHQEIIKLMERMVEFEKMEWTSQPLNNLATQYSILTSKVKELEKVLELFKECSFDESLNNCLMRISKIENDLNSMDGLKEIWLAINELRGRNPYSKHPHKCPVCEGAGDFLIQNEREKIIFKVSRTDALGNSFHNCHVCVGQGIVWG